MLRIVEKNSAIYSKREISFAIIFKKKKKKTKSRT